MASHPLQTPHADEMPDIFHAADVNDVNEMNAALRDGQRLDEQRSDMLNMTPLHVACIKSSTEFVQAALLEPSCDPWLRDDNLRVAFDHAAARRNQPAMRALLSVMHPEP